MSNARKAEPMQQQNSTRSTQHGFTLIEVLITLVILSVGLLGIASLHATAKRSGHQAWQRTLAVTLADDMIERIRINPGQAAAYHTGLGTNALGGGTITDVPTDCSAGACTPAELAAWDLWDWEQRLDGAMITDADGGGVGGLIDPRACIVFTPADLAMPNSGQLSVILTWYGTVQTTDAVQAGEDVCGEDDADSDGGRRRLVLNTYIVDNEDLFP